MSPFKTKSLLSSHYLKKLLINIVVIFSSFFYSSHYQAQKTTKAQDTADHLASETVRASTRPWNTFDINGFSSRERTKILKSLKSVWKRQSVKVLYLFNNKSFLRSVLGKSNGWLDSFSVFVFRTSIIFFLSSFRD